MPITIDETTRRITITQDYLTPVSGNLYELDTEDFRTDMNDLMDDERFIWLPDYARRNAPVTVAGVTLAQSIEIINGFSVEFDDTPGFYSVRLAGSNNNLFDAENGILVPNQTQVIATNSAGLITVATGGSSAPTAGEVAEEVWDHEQASSITAPERPNRLSVVNSFLPFPKKEVL